MSLEGINPSPSVAAIAIEKPWKDKTRELSTELAEAKVVLSKVAEVKDQEISQLSGQVSELQKHSAEQPQVQVSQIEPKGTGSEPEAAVDKVVVEASTPELSQEEEIGRLSAQIADLTKKKYQLALKERIGLSVQMRRFLYAPVPQEAIQRHALSETKKAR